jgi:hypothetical protein
MWNKALATKMAYWFATLAAAHLTAYVTGPSVQALIGAWGVAITNPDAFQTHVHAALSSLIVMASALNWHFMEPKIISPVIPSNGPGTGSGTVIGDGHTPTGK